MAKYDGQGNRLWLRQTGTVQNDQAFAAVVDSSGNVIICGITAGNFGGPVTGYGEGFLIKYDTGGTRRWIRQFDRGVYGMAVDEADRLYVIGSKHITLYNPDGDWFWEDDFHVSEPGGATSVSIDKQFNIFICGYEQNPVNLSWDVFLIKYALFTECDYELAGDLDDDCRINLTDFAVMAANWLVDCTVEPLSGACITGRGGDQN